MAMGGRGLINFELTSLERVGAWENDGALHLNWFGLSDGYYWLVADRDELFRYSDGFLARFPPDSVAILPYVDYYVARLHEDLIYMLPAILEPVPKDIAHLVNNPDRTRAWAVATRHWLDKQHEDADEAWRAYYQAVTWWDERRLDAGYLVNPPTIYCWRVDETIRLRWDNRERREGDVSVWSASLGEISLDADQFLDAVRTFDRRFLTAMRRRVKTAVGGNWSRPSVRTDPGELRAEQTLREDLLPTTLARGANQTDWDAVRHALASMRLH
jgi:hypothetical protein